MNASPPSHPTDQILYAYGLGKLGDPAASEVDVHLEACPACRQRVSELSGDSFVGRLRDAGARPETPVPGPAPSGGVKKEDGPSKAVPIVSPDPALAGSLPPELVNHPQYRVIRELGRGGMGIVYLARNTILDRLEVLKVLNKEMLDRKGACERFRREMQSAARLNHPNIVGAYAALEFERLLVFAMEYVDGEDLAKYVKSRGPRPVMQACSMIYQAALGLQHAHEQGMVHRDIKPGNLMFARQGQRGVVKLLDFGLAKATSENPFDGSLTREGQMLGTVDFIAPEQSVDAQKADICADIYSLGCTLYYLLTGAPPFGGTSLALILQAHHSIDAKPLNLVRPEVPVELAALVGKMMAKDPTRRYQSPAEVALALKPFCKAGKAGSGSPDGEHFGPRSPEAVQAAAARVAPPLEPVPAGGVPVAAKGGAAPPSDQSLRWESLIAIPEPEHLSDARPPAAKPLRRRPPWVGPALAIGLLLLWLAVGWAAGVFKTGDGVIVLKGVPEQAEVFIDGRNVSVQMHDGGGPLEVTVPAGKRGVQVKKGGFQAFGEEVMVSTGARVEIRVRLIPMPPPPVPVPREIRNSIGMKLVLIPAGEFLMGSSKDLDNYARDTELPQHRVRITRPFYLGVTEVTQGQYRAVTGQSPSNFKGSDDLPVEQVSWFDAVNFCNAVSRREGVPPFYGVDGQNVAVPDWKGAGYRLPTEAEWEYACRAKNPARYSFGDDPVGLGEHAWFDGNSGNQTHPVGQKRPNAFGLFDMHGNVYECCWDGFETKYYAESPIDDPRGPSGASVRVVRGGSWNWFPGFARSANRWWRSPEYRYLYLGFRVARVQSEANPLPPPVPQVIVNPPAPPIEEKTPAPTALVPDAQPTAAPEEASKAIAKKSTGPGTRRKPPQATKDAPKAITNSIGMKLALIPAGEFLMGSPDDDKDAGKNEKPQHRVRITRPFFLGVTEVTQGQYRAVTGQNLSHFKGSDDMPVETVSWLDAVNFCNALSGAEGLPLFYWVDGPNVAVPNWKGAGYRLPTEAEWEYACRAKNPARYSFGDDPVGLGEHAWFGGNSENQTHPVGTKKANEFGLFDMHGNVREWCSDGYQGEFYARLPADDPVCPFEGASDRVIRGGCWYDIPQYARSAYRSRYAPGFRDVSLGFRLARVQSGR